MKSKDEQNTLKKKVDTVNKKYHELTDEELSQVAGGGYRYYKVKSGDKLADIAQYLGVSLNTLIALNGIKSPDLIYPGQSLKYPC